MAKQAVILTPSKGFGELVRQVLADTSQLRPQLLSSPSKALKMAAAGDLSLLVLDTDFNDLDLAAYVAQLRKAAGDAHLIVIPTENKPHDPTVHELSADAVLPSPFYLPDLVAAVEKLYGPLGRIELPPLPRSNEAVAVKASGTAYPAPGWLADIKLSAQHLAQLSLESASQAALITRGAQVWAYAGQLPQAAAEEVAAAITSDSAENSADLARFVHLDATGADYVMYATSLGSEYKLALVFDAQMPFSKMRAQVDKLASAMAGAIVSEAGQAAQQPVMQEAAVSRRGAAEEPRRSAPAALPEEPPLQPAARTLAAQPLALQRNNLTYAYVLIPRLPEHRLEGDLAERLAAWLPQLCVAFAWRLEHISIQPGLLQWMVSVSPETAPESIVRTLELHLSERIFDEFSKLERDNPSGEFFAPAFLVVSGSLPNADQVVDFIKHTRARQGVPS